jgi:probable phosphoglycerate mutase
VSLGWPASLRLVRHAQSTANVDSDQARARGAEHWDTPERDPDVPLTEEGMNQARHLGRALRRLPEQEVPEALWCSPFVRAETTARLVVDECRWNHVPWTVDERLRDREGGIVDRLTGRGIQARYPELADLRRRFGRFYFRPPGGEAWTDVALRLRSALLDIRLRHEGGNVIVFGHDVVVLLFRYILEDMDEAEVLEISRRDPVRNASVTSYHLRRGQLKLTTYNWPQEDTGAARASP